MAYLGIDTSDTGTLSDYTPVPPGEYIAKIISSETKENKRQDGYYCKFTFEIQDGEHAGRQLTAFINFDNPNPKTVEIAKKELNSIAAACGLLTFPAETDPVENVLMRIVVKVTEPSGNYGPGNAIINYKPINDNAAAPAASGGFRPQAANANGGAPKAAPWKRAS